MDRRYEDKGWLAGYASRAYRRLTSPIRALPDFLLIGGMRCGTTSVTSWLKLHPEVGGSTVREVHYFDRYYDRGTNWYRSHFDYRKTRRLTFEKSASYMLVPGTAGRAAALLPDARLVAIVREPAQRAWSHYRWRSNNGNESRTFREAVESELSGPLVTPSYPSDRQDMPYVAAGRYASQLAPWIESYGPESLLIIDSHRLFEDPEPQLKRLCDHIGLDRGVAPFVRRNQSPAEKPDSGIIRLLREHYAESDRRLADMMGESPSWVVGSTTI
ncbi:MAG: sulfotransferase family protein [Acidimicrobiia bacterium]